MTSSVKSFFLKYRFPLIASAIYFFIANSLCLFKFYALQYTQLDLAIFSNALRQPWSHLLYSTIQEHHYFGDHLAPYLALIKHTDRVAGISGSASANSPDESTTPSVWKSFISRAPSPICGLIMMVNRAV